ncbi:MFS general substrate transporter, partial [Auriscalpium vulgare]
MAYFLIRKLVHHIQDKREHAATSPSRQQQQHASATQPDLEQDDLSVHDEKSSLTFKLTLLVSLAIPVYLETLDYTVVATAQPHIASVFNRLDLQSYIGTIYLLTSTVFLPFFGSLSDVYGRHFALQVALLFFLIGSALCTGAQNMPMLLAGRGISGIGAGGILTGVR